MANQRTIEDLAAVQTVESLHAEEVAEVKPLTAMLTVKGVPLRTRETMNRLARKRGQTVGRWLTELVEQGEQVQAGDMVDPGLFSPPARAKYVEPGAGSDERPQMALTPAELAQLVEVAGLTGSAQAQRLAGRLVVDYLRMARASVRPMAKLAPG